MKFDLKIKTEDLFQSILNDQDAGTFELAIGQMIKGDSGKSPYIDETTKTWWEYNDTTKEYEDTGIAAKSVDLYNITNEIPLGAGLFYTLSTAITATPESIRKKGLILMFESASGVWETYQFKGVIANWSVLGSWSNDLSLKIDKIAIKQIGGNSTTDILSQNSITNKLTRLRNGLPMVTPDSILTNIRDVLSPDIVSNFLLDFKLSGVAENEYTYGISTVNYNAAPDSPHNFYFAISKYNSSGIETNIYSVFLGTPTILGKQKYLFLTNSNGNTVTGGTLYVDWDALIGLNGGQYTGWYNAGYRFDNAYLFDSNIGILYDENRIDTLDERVDTLDEREKEIPFLRNGFPMVSKGNILKNMTVTAGTVGIGNVLSPSLFSDFLLDFKLQGVPEPGYLYGVFLVQNAIGGDYSYYVAISKYNEEGEETIVARCYFSSNSSGVIKYEGTPVSTETNVTKIILLLDWDAIKHIPGFYGSFYTDSSFYTAGYRFKNEYLFDSTTGKIAVENRIESIENLASTTNAKLITEEATTWELANDLDFFTANYRYCNIGQYSDIMTENTTFSKIRLNQINYNGTIAYKAYIVNNLATRGVRGCPTGIINATTHTLLKEDNINATTGYKDYIIQLNDAYNIPIGSQVVVYMVASSQIYIKGSSGGLGNPEKTSHAALLNVNANPFESSWGAGSVNEATNTGYYNVALTLFLSPIFVTNANLSESIQIEVSNQIPEILAEFLASDLLLTIPNEVYAVVGTELNLWNDAVSLSVDKGLSSPLNYQVRWYCTKGLITDRCFRFTPTDSDIGTVSCTCYIYDMRGSLIDSKTFSIIVSAKNAIAAAKNIVYFGDSLGAGAASGLYNNFNNVDKFTGIIPIMRGTRGTTIKYEAVGGYGWWHYATSGNYAYRIQVTGVTSASVGATYTLNSYPNPFTIREVNIVDGTGNMLIEYQYGAQVSDFPATGAFNKVSGAGDSVINFTGGLQEPNNPLWNSSTDELDVALYKTRIGLTVNDKIDAVSFQFGINDNGLANDLTTLMTFISDLYNAFITDNPNCKFIIGLTTSSGNDVNGAGSNYGASYDYLTYLSNTYKIRQFYLTLQNSAQYPNIVIAPVSLLVDRYYGYAFSERAISQRYTTTEKYHNNYVHPTSSGFGQMADMYFATYIYALTN